MHAPYVSAAAKEKSNSSAAGMDSDSARVQLKESLRGKSFAEAEADEAAASPMINLRLTGTSSDAPAATPSSFDGVDEAGLFQFNDDDIDIFHPV